MAPFLRAVSLRQTRMGGTVWPEEGADGWNGEKPQNTITHNLSVPIGLQKGQRMPGDGHSPGIYRPSSLLVGVPVRAAGQA